MRAMFRSVVLCAIVVAIAGCPATENGFRDVGGRDGSSDGGDGLDAVRMDGALDAPGIDALDANNVNLPDGSVPLDDGTWLLPDGAHVYPDGGPVPTDGGGMDATAPTDGSMYYPPDGATMLDGAWVLPDGAIWTPSCPALADGGAGCRTTETCSNGLDDNCNGLVDEGCPCIPMTDHERCYDGCPSQAGVGVCTWGVITCMGTGEFGMYDGHCIGATHPQPVVCGGFRDWLCDGITDEGCSCTAGQTRACYTGPAATRNIGACQDGSQTCVAATGGTAWGPCTGEVLPAAPACDGIDHACDGMPYEGCACMPGTTRSCYDGPTGTAGVGLCHAGLQSCTVAGGVASWGTCIGQVLPAPNRCDGLDRLCNGMPDVGCACAPGAVRGCYTGPAGTSGVGLCRAGMQSCVDAGSGPQWGMCTGQVLPASDTCDGLDHDCDGLPNTGCLCNPGDTRSCYDGPAATLGVGVCRAGMQTCVSGPGGVGANWGGCTGEVLPGPIVCDGIDHACDGNYPADCPCMPGAMRSCYTGPAGTAGVGTCAPGSQTCVTRTGGGTTWGACAGEVVPTGPMCDGLDHECIGTLPSCAPTVICPAPVTTTLGVGVSLRGAATAIAPATVAAYQWSVISAPAGAAYTFSSTTTNPTTFTATSGGVYTVRLTVTDTMGRSSSCTVLVTVTARSYLGTEFWAVTTTNSELDTGTTFQFAVAIGNPNSVAVTATVYNGGTTTVAATFSVPANSTVTQTLPWVNALAHNSGTGRGVYTPSASSLVANGAYRVSTTAPVSAYQFNPLTFSTGGGSPTYSYTNGASLLLPTVALSGNYLTLTHNSFAGGGSFVAIAGTNPTPTTVSVRLSSAILAGPGVTAAAAGTTQTYTLNRGDVVQLIADYRQLFDAGRTCAAGCLTNSTCNAATGQCRCNQYYGPIGGGRCAQGFLPADLTGTTITATQDVAVFTGEDCSQMSFPNGIQPACDHLEQQLFPSETWGRDAVVSQFQDRGVTERFMVRIMSRENSNTITFTPSSVHANVTLNRGQTVEFEASTDFLVSGTQPILVAQYMEGDNSVCPAGRTYCNTETCVNTQTSFSNCGACGRSCAAGQVCSGGACRASCPSGTISCTGDCVPTYSTTTIPLENYNCGTCGQACPFQYTCAVTGPPTRLACTAPATPAAGDPDFVFEVPTPQYRRDYNFVVPSTYTNSYINVVFQTGATLVLDGTTVATAGTAIPGTTWSVLRRSIAAGSHTINTPGSAGFGLKVFGVALYTSYAYPGGLDLQTLP